MRKKILALAIMIAVILPLSINAATAKYEVPSTFRTWKYLNFTTVLSPNWAFVVMPGSRYEHYRTGGDEKMAYYNDLFIGPVFIKKINKNWKFKLPVWYYFMEFPNNNTNVFFSHNLEIIPIIAFSSGKFSISNRMIFHNTLYTTLYEKAKIGGDPAGFSSLLRELVKVSYKVNKKVSVHTAGEIFYGLKDNGEKAVAKGGRPAVFGPGFSPTGLVRTRVYVGFKWNFAPSLALTPEYIWERNIAYDDHPAVLGKVLKTGDLVETDHYFKFVLSYTLNLIKKAPKKKAPETETK